MTIRVVGEKFEPVRPSKPEPLKWLDMSGWDRTPMPERKWAIRDRVPLKQADCSPARAAPANPSSS
jgi:hypothetical protein